MKSIILNSQFRGQYIIIIFVFFTATAFAQSKKEKEKTMFGLGADFNFQTVGAAIDLRAKIPVYKNTYITPRLAYFPGANNIHEYYFGADANYHPYQYKKLKPYVYLGGYYDRWINADDFVSNKAKKNNFVFEGGTGVVFDLGCLNPYIEYRYDTKWKEGTMGLGVFFKFCKCFTPKRKKIRCPAFS